MLRIMKVIIPQAAAIHSASNAEVLIDAQYVRRDQ